MIRTRRDYFEVEVAREVGLNAATVASFLWDIMRVDPKMKYRHGHAWVKASYGFISLAMPYLTKCQARHAVKKLIKKGYIRKGCYSDNKFDHTNWYAFTEYGSAMMNFGESYEEEDD